MENKIGQTLGNKYRVMRLIGRGGMGSVYEAEHTILNRRVAVKMLSPAYRADRTAVKRFILEGQTASAIDHPNVVQVFDFCQDPDGSVYLVMELLKGVSLRMHMDQRGPLPIPQAVSIVTKVLSVLQAIHDQGIIHRDLKPENIYVAFDGGNEQVKLMDFGVAKLKDMTGNGLRLTSTGSVPGTPYYLAPELAKGGKDVDEGIDIWAMGVVLYEMLTGNVPFEGENYNEVLSKILMSEPAPIRSLCADVPEGLAEVVEKALAKQRQDRFGCADEMREALLPFIGSGGFARTTAVLTGVKEERVGVFPIEPGGRGSHPSSDAASGEPVGSAAEVLEMTVSSTWRSRPTRWIGFLAIALVGAAVLWGVTRGEDDGKIQGGGTLAAPSAVDKARDVPSPQAPTTHGETAIKTGENGPDAAEGAAEPGKAKPVSIDIEGIPAGALVTVDGVARPLPLLLPKSDTPVTVKVTAAGYGPVERRVVPGGDQTVSMVLKKLRPAKSTSPRKPDPDAPKKKSGAWRANPFAE